MKSKLNFGAAILCCSISIALSFAANNMLLKFTHGIWSIEQGAPWIAIYAVFIIPAVFSAVSGLLFSGGGIIISIVSPFIIAIFDYIICLIIGIFLSGEAFNLVVSIIVIAALLSGPGYILVILIDN